MHFLKSLMEMKSQHWIYLLISAEFDKYRLKWVRSGGLPRNSDQQIDSRSAVCITSFWANSFPNKHIFNIFLYFIKMIRYITMRYFTDTYNHWDSTSRRWSIHLPSFRCKKWRGCIWRRCRSECYTCVYTIFVFNNLSINCIISYYN